MIVQTLRFALLAAVAVFVAWLLGNWAPAASTLTLVPSFPFRCANCGEDLHVGMRKRRHLPRMGGKRRVVCVKCAREIDSQATLTLDVPSSRRRVA